MPAHSAFAGLARKFRKLLARTQAQPTARLTSRLRRLADRLERAARPSGLRLATGALALAALAPAEAMAQPFAKPVCFPFGLELVVRQATPRLEDIDGDGDFDAFIGDYDGNIWFSRNDGTSGAPSFAVPVSNSFGLANVGYSALPCFVDIDNDGDLDAFIGNAQGNTIFFLNNGLDASGNPIFSASVQNPFGLADVGLDAELAFADIDGDGDFDVSIRNFNINTVFFRNDGTPGAPSFVAAEMDHFDWIYFQNNFRRDIDGDGDLDAIYGHVCGLIVFSENLAPPATTWDGSSWSKGAPTVSLDAILAADYFGPGFACDDLRLDADLTIGATEEFTVEGAITGKGSVNLLSSSKPGYYDYSIGSLIHATPGVPGSVERYLSGGANVAAGEKWQFVQSPVGDFAVADEFLADDVYRYDAAGDAWQRLVLGDDFWEGQTYLVHSPDSETKTFSGPLNAGRFSFAGPNIGEYAIIGNPYPSPIDWALVSLGGASPTAYVWNAASNSYDCHNQAAGTGAFSTGMIPSTQGFAVYSSATFVPEIELTDAVRQHPSDFLGKSGQLPLVRLRLEAPASQAEIVAYAHGGEALAGQDGFDSPKMPSFVESASEAAFLLGGAGYAISALDALKGSLPIRFEAGTEGAHSFALAVENFDQKVFLEDAQTGTLHDFSSGAYAFQSAVGEFDGRFTLHLAGTVTSSESVDALAHVAFHDGQALRVVVAGAEPQAFRLVDLAGRVLAQGIAQPGDNAVATGQLASGVYLMSIGQQAAIKLVVR